MTQIHVLLSDKERLLMQQLYVALLVQGGKPVAEVEDLTCYPWEVRR